MPFIDSPRPLANPNPIAPPNDGIEFIGNGIRSVDAPFLPGVGGLEDLANRRAVMSVGPAGPGSPPTLSRLDVEGMNPLFGTSGHNRDVTLTVNPISRTHAEADVLQQLANSGGANGGNAVLYIDHPDGLCGACGRSGAVRSMARQVGISELRVVWPGGELVIVP